MWHIQLDILSKDVKKDMNITGCLPTGTEKDWLTVAFQQESTGQNAICRSRVVRTTQRHVNVMKYRPWNMCLSLSTWRNCLMWKTLPGLQSCLPHIPDTGKTSVFGRGVGYQIMITAPHR